MRRAINCEYCAPKSRTTMDWVSTDECLRLLRRLQQNQNLNHRGHRGTQGNRGEKQMLSCVFACGYRTTMFTSFFGTSMTMPTCLPAIAARTFSSASALCL